MYKPLFMLKQNNKAINLDEQYRYMNRIQHILHQIYYEQRKYIGLKIIFVDSVNFCFEVPWA